ncbi:MAG: DUF5989 family protein [Candidatus Hinthialibacter antarcticus]|nr:DUF5989 family protein [Candidatus Hinthialibacter antarcticus]
MTNSAPKPARRSLLSELGYFFMRYKMWWLVPVVAIVLLLGLLVVLGGTQGVFLIYALF